MIALRSSTEPSPHDETWHAAAQLLGRSPLRVQLVAQGANSSVHKVICCGRAYALKRYPAGEPAAPHDRQTRERDALTFIRAQGLKAVPRFFAADCESGFSLMEWVDGAPVRRVTERAILQAVGFLSALAALPRDEETATFPLAKEACLSGAEILRQIRERHERLSHIAATDPVLAEFLQRELSPAVEKCVSLSPTLCERAGIGCERQLMPNQRRLVPSDFGFHNAIRGRRGQLTFVDFEYFGWDDPVKLSADLLLHPGFELTDRHRIQLRSGLASAYRRVEGFRSRLDAFLPLFTVRWALIMLNVFRPEWVESRQHLVDMEPLEMLRAMRVRKVRRFLSDRLAALPDQR